VFLQCVDFYFLSVLINPTAVHGAPAFAAGFLTPRGGIEGFRASLFVVESHLAADKNGEERIAHPDSLSTVWRRIANSEPPKEKYGLRPDEASRSESYRGSVKSPCCSSNRTVRTANSESSSPKEKYGPSLR